MTDSAHVDDGSAPPKRRKTGGRKAGTPNKITRVLKDAAAPLALRFAMEVLAGKPIRKGKPRDKQYEVPTLNQRIDLFKEVAPKIWPTYKSVEVASTNVSATLHADIPADDPEYLERLERLGAALRGMPEPGGGEPESQRVDRPLLAHTAEPIPEPVPPQHKPPAYPVRGPDSEELGHGYTIQRFFDTADKRSKWRCSHNGAEFFVTYDRESAVELVGQHRRDRRS